MPELILKHSASVGTPSNGAVSIYAKSDNSLYTKDSSGNESTIMYEGAGKNRIINGAMQIAQRGVGPTAVANGQLIVDRWTNSISYGGTLTVSQDPDVPTNAQASRTFKNSLKLSTTQDAAVAAGDIVSIYQVIEGYNIADIVGDGYNNGFTLSFWVKSSKTGIYCVTCGEGGLTRTYSAEYTINAVSTWEKKTVTITAAPSGGTWNSTNGAGIYLFFTMMAGTSWNTNTANTWNSTDDRATANQVNWADTNGATFFLTGVQLEAGTRATNYEFRSYGQELALCQRYYYRLDAAAVGQRVAIATGVVESTTTTSLYPFLFPTAMRSTPSLSPTPTAADFDAYDGASAAACSAISITSSVNTTNCLLTTTHTALGSGKASILFGDTTAARSLGFSAEF
jgi:hypothetical protein